MSAWVICLIIILFSLLFGWQASFWLRYSYRYRDYRDPGDISDLAFAFWIGLIMTILGPLGCIWTIVISQCTETPLLRKR